MRSGYTLRRSREVTFRALARGGGLSKLCTLYFLGERRHAMISELSYANEVPSVALAAATDSAETEKMQGQLELTLVPGLASPQPIWRDPAWIAEVDDTTDERLEWERLVIDSVSNPCVHSIHSVVEAHRDAFIGNNE